MVRKSTFLFPFLLVISFSQPEYDGTGLYFEFTDANRISVKKCVARNIWGKVGRVGNCWHFFGFSIITVELLIVEEIFSSLKFRSHRAASFPYLGISLRQFSLE